TASAVVIRSLTASKSPYLGSSRLIYFHHGKSGPPSQGHFSTYNVRLPIFRTDSSRLLRRVSTAENTPIIVMIPMVTPSKDSNVRVLLSFRADNANPKLSLSSVKTKNLSAYKYNVFIAAKE